MLLGSLTGLADSLRLQDRKPELRSEAAGQGVLSEHVQRGTAPSLADSLAAMPSHGKLPLHALPGLSSFSLALELPAKRRRWMQCCTKPGSPQRPGSFVSIVGCRTRAALEAWTELVMLRSEASCMTMF